MSTHLKSKNSSILMKYSNIKSKKYNHKKHCYKINSNNIKKYSLSGNNKFNKINKISTSNGLKSKNKDNLFLLDNSNSQLQNKIFPKKFLKLGWNKLNSINGKINFIPDKSILTLKIKNSIKNSKILLKDKIYSKQKRKSF